MNNSYDADSPQNVKKESKFPLWKQIAFLAAVCLCSFVYAVGIADSMGFMLVSIAAAMNFLYAMHAGDSVARLLLLLLVNIVPFVGATVYFVSVASALPALFPLMMALPIWLTVRMGLGRAVSVASAAVTAALLYAAMFAAAIYEHFGAVNADTVLQAIDLLFVPIRDRLLLLVTEVGEEAALPITVTDIDAVLYYVKTMLFGIISACTVVWAYITTVAIRVGAELIDMTDVLPQGLRIGMRMSMTANGPQVEMTRERVLWRIEIDSVSAVMYIAAYLVGMLFGSIENMTVAATAAANLVLMLSPGFLYCGARDFFLGFSGRSSTGRVNKFFLIPAIILIFINPMLIFMLLCVMGVIVTFRENGARRRMEKNGKEHK